MCHCEKKIHRHPSNLVWSGLGLGLWSFLLCMISLFFYVETYNIDQQLFYPVHYTSCTCKASKQYDQFICRKVTSIDISQMFLLYLPQSCRRIQERKMLIDPCKQVPSNLAPPTSDWTSRTRVLYIDHLAEFPNNSEYPYTFLHPHKQLQKYVK